MLTVRTVNNIDPGQLPVGFLRNDGADFSGKVEPDARETLQKFIDAVQGRPLIESGCFDQVGSAVIVAGDNDIFSNAK